MIPRFISLKHYIRYRNSILKSKQTTPEICDLYFRINNHLEPKSGFNFKKWKKQYYLNRIKK